MKDIFIRFSVPDDFDAPSEMKERIKAMLLEALGFQYALLPTDQETLQIINALLAEF